MINNNVKIIKRDELYQGFVRLEKLKLKFKKFDGNWSREHAREVMIRYRVAGVLPYDPQTKQVVLIEQFRVGALEDQTSPWLLELVAGVMDKNLSAEDLAREELQEEAGLTAKKLIPIHDYWSSPGGTNEKVALFCGLIDASCAGGIHGAAAEDEDIKVHVFAAEVAFAMVRNGKINNAATIVALQWLELNQNNI